MGDALARAWAKRGARVVAADSQPCPGARVLDMADGRAVRAILAEMEPDIVAVPAGKAHVDYCEINPRETRRVNVEATVGLARACKEAGARMIFFSSDYVFDGTKGGYQEDDAVNPLNEYGRQKAETEAAVLEISSRNLVIRTSSVYGWEWAGKNFVLQIVRRLSSREALKVASEIFCNPTYAENLAEVTVALAENGQDGIFHVVGRECLKRFDFARLAAKTFGLDESLLIPVSSAEFPSPTRRPLDPSLLTGKVRAAVSLPLLGAAEGLERMRAFRAEWGEHARTHLPSSPQFRS